jgi:hypothetical protein
MSRINRFVGIVLISLMAVAVGGGCCLNNCCTTGVGVGDCTSYPGSDGCCGGDMCGGCADIGPGCGGGCGGGWYGGCGWTAGFWDGCGAGCGGGWTPGCGPIMGLLRMVRQAIFCGGGCGGVYWGDWFGDPPACQDPCCFDSGCGGCGGCATCDAGSCGGINGTTQLSQRNHNWSSGTTCNGNCQAHANGGSRPAHSRIASRRPSHTRGVKSAAKSSQYRPGDRVLNTTTTR